MDRPTAVRPLSRGEWRGRAVALFSVLIPLQELAQRLGLQAGPPWDDTNPSFPVHVGCALPSGRHIAIVEYGGAYCSILTPGTAESLAHVLDEILTALGLNRADIGAPVTEERWAAGTKTTVPIDADGTIGNYLLVIVEKETGVVYEQQCGGLYNEQRIAEGFVVIVGGHVDVTTQAELDDLFERVNHHNPPTDEDGWRRIWPAQLEELRGLVERIPIFGPSDFGVSRDFLRLDNERLAELTEAWVPVKTLMGRAILTWPNSD
jgi:hypothetical protein